MSEPTRAESEAKVVDAVREMLPDLHVPGSRITIVALDAQQPESDGAHFRVEKVRAHICRR